MARGWVLLMNQLLGEDGAEAELEAAIEKLKTSGEDGEILRRAVQSAEVT